MPRYRLTVEYDGGPYCGFQAQAALPTVQTSLERAIKAFTGQAVTVNAAGRTDTGVHALGQVAHIDLERDWPADTVREAMNAHLVKEPIVVLDAALAPADFHSRFSATGRRYLYRILNRRAPDGVWARRTPRVRRARRRPGGQQGGEDGKHAWGDSVYRKAAFRP